MVWCAAVPGRFANCHEREGDVSQASSDGYRAVPVFRLLPGLKNGAQALSVS